MEATESLFVIGSPRSGTSILGISLSQHPDFWTSAESDYLWYLYGQHQLREAYDKVFDRPEHRSWLIRHEVSYTEFAAHIGAGIDQLYRSRSGGKRWIDATPTYTQMAGVLADLFPHARFIHILRDGRSVVGSMLGSGFDIDWAGSFKAAAQTWVKFSALATDLCTAIPERSLQLKLEALSADPAGEFAGILDFLGAAEHEAPADYFKRNRINSSFGDSLESDPRSETSQPSERAIPWASWSRRQRSQFEKIAGDAMIRFGYALDWD